MTALGVVAAALVVLALVQLAALVACWAVLRRAEEALREAQALQRAIAGAATDIGQAARQFGELAGSGRSILEGILGMAAWGRFAPKVGAARTALDLGMQLWRALAALRRKKRD